MHDAIPRLSVILTTYNEAYLLEESVREVKKVLDRLRYPYEIVIADDGSRDESVALAARLASADPCIKAVARAENRGRGQTVEDGIRAATGDIVGFIDTDLEIAPENIFPLVTAIEHGADVTTGFRFFTFNIFNFYVRWLTSWGYALLMHWFLRVPFKDTEAGIKFFRRERILPVLDEIQAKGWPWDTEVVVKAHYHGLKVLEVPVTLVRKADVPTTVKLFATIRDYLKNLWRLRREIRALRR